MKTLRVLSLFLAAFLVLSALCACRTAEEESGHSYGPWIVEDAPGYERKGTLVRRCEDPDCSHEQRREIYASKGLSYTEEDGETFVAGLGTYKGDFLYIASETPDGRRVRGIAHSAFTDETGFAHAYIEDGVSEVRGYAFSGCTALSSARLPEECTLFEAGVFLSCKSLASVSLPKNIETLPESCFDGCTALRRIDLPENVTVFEHSAFNLCESLTSLRLPEGLVTIGSNCFDGCKSLSSLVDKSGDARLPASLREVGNYAFADCAALERISFDMPLEELGFSVFAGCTSLARVFLSKDIVHISAPNGKSPFLGANPQAKIVTDANEKPDGWDEFFAVYDYIDAENKDTEFLYLPVEYSGQAVG